MDLLTCREGGGSEAKKVVAPDPQGGYSWSSGAIIRGDSTKKKLALVFTGDEFADGGDFIAEALKNADSKASFFLTGRFYRNPTFWPVIRRLKDEGHYLGAHSNEHLLYCDWSKRDSLLVTEDEFKIDLINNYAELTAYGIQKTDARFFLPPFEWYNDTIAAWTKELSLQLINFTPGTLSHTDYTKPTDRNYRDSESIFKSITLFEKSRSAGLNGFILLMHIGAHPDRKDKFHEKLPALLKRLAEENYELVRIDELLSH